MVNEMQKRILNMEMVVRYLTTTSSQGGGPNAYHATKMRLGSPSQVMKKSSALKHSDLVKVLVGN